MEFFSFGLENQCENKQSWEPGINDKRTDAYKNSTVTL